MQVHQRAGDVLERQGVDPEQGRAVGFLVGLALIGVGDARLRRLGRIELIGRNPAAGPLLRDVGEARPGRGALQILQDHIGALVALLHGQIVEHVGVHAIAFEQPHRIGPARAGHGRLQVVRRFAEGAIAGVVHASQ